MDPSPELRQVIAGWFESLVQGDTTWPSRHISRMPEVRLIGTDPNEWINGSEAVDFLTAEAKALASSVQISIGEVEAFEEGTVGWGVARPTISLPNGSHFSPRWAAVFHRENNTWKAVQIHASIGIGNEELFGE